VRISNFLLWQIAYAELQFLDIFWQFYSNFYIFDIKEMKIVQELKVSSMPYTVSKDFKKVAFIKNYKVYIYNIVEGE
jgi:hypothetical protein